MARPAEDIYKVVKKNRVKIEDNSVQQLREKCVEAVNQMMKAGELVTEVDLTEEDLRGLVSVTQELRSLNYYYCLIESQDIDGDIESHRLRISIAHLEEDDDN